MIFIERYKNMKCDFKDIHKAIDFWHEEYKGDLELHEMLGLSWKEYNLFVKDEEAFKDYLYNTYGTFDFSLRDHYDDSGIDIIEILSWHHANGNLDYLDIDLTVTPRFFDEEFEDDE